MVKCKLFKGYVEVKGVNYRESVEVKGENITYYSKQSEQLMGHFIVRGHFTQVKSPMNFHGEFYPSGKTLDYEMTH